MTHTYSTADICERFEFTRQYLAALRSGARKPHLIEGEDWKWDRGVIIYLPSAVKKIEKART
jgi:hypothetical protein